MNKLGYTSTSLALPRREETSSNWPQNPLTLRNHHGILPLTILRNHRRKETHEYGGTKDPLSFSWRMDGPYAQKEQRNPVCVCIQKKARESTESVLCSFVKGRTNGDSSSSREAGTDQKIKPGYFWRQNKIAAVRLFLTDWNPRRNSPKINLPIFSIHRLPSYGKVLCIRMVGTEKKVCS